ncbi:MAG: histidine phosphatase family protein [Anaerolineae bacterium]
MMLRLLLARHGESQWQVLGDEAGPNSVLTELGRFQADRLGRWLAGHFEVDHIYASPLRRAQETAQSVAGHLGLAVEVHGDLAESAFLVQPKLPAFSSPLETVDGGFADELPSHKDYRLFRSRVAGALKDILGRHEDGTVLIVAHAGTIGTVFRLLLGSDTFTVNVGNTTLHSLRWNGGQWHIEFVDRWDHLRGL